jgi:hypothetical protein
MKISRFILDMDDVCNDFTLPALMHVGCSSIKGPRDFGAYNPKWGYNILRAANELNQEIVFMLRNFWNSFTSDVWASMPESEEFNFVLETALNMVGEEGILIATAPICDPKISIEATEGCLAGKYQWITEHFPPFLHRSFSMTPMKHFCATPESLLLDDCDENVEKFRAAGGQAILMPRPWNKANGKDPIQYIATELQKVLR